MLMSLCVIAGSLKNKIPILHTNEIWSLGHAGVLGYYSVVIMRARIVKDRDFIFRCLPFDRSSVPDFGTGREEQHFLLEVLEVSVVFFSFFFQNLLHLFI
jgi:hypothetical protein